MVLMMCFADECCGDTYFASMHGSEVLDKVLARSIEHDLLYEDYAADYAE